jgi:hypothetical protein
VTPALAEVRAACFTRGDVGACDALRDALSAEVATALAAGAPAPRLHELLALTLDEQAWSWVACHLGATPCADDADLFEHCVFADGWLAVAASAQSGAEIGPRIVVRTGREAEWAPGPWCALRPTADGGLVGVAGARCDAAVRLDGALREVARIPVPPLTAIDPLHPGTKGSVGWIGGGGVVVADAAGVRFAGFSDGAWRRLDVRADEVSGVAGAVVIAGGAAHGPAGTTPLAGHCRPVRDRVYCADEGLVWDATASPRAAVARVGTPPGWVSASLLPDQPPETLWPAPVPPVTSREVVVRAAPGAPVALTVVVSTPGLPDFVRAEHQVAARDGLASFRVPPDAGVQVGWRVVDIAQGTRVVDLPALAPHRVRVFGPDGRPAAGARVASREDVTETDAEGWTAVSCRDLVSAARGADAAVARCDAEEIHLVAGARARCRWAPTGAEGWCDTLAEREGAGPVSVREQGGVWQVTPTPARSVVLRPPAPIPAEVAEALDLGPRPGLSVERPGAADPRVCVDPEVPPEGPVTLTFRACPGVEPLRIVDPDGTPVWTWVAMDERSFLGVVDRPVWLPARSTWTDTHGVPLQRVGDTLVTPRSPPATVPTGDPRLRLSGVWFAEGGSTPAAYGDGDTLTFPDAPRRTWTVTRVWAGGAQLEASGSRALALFADGDTLVWWDEGARVLHR